VSNRIPWTIKRRPGKPILLTGEIGAVDYGKEGDSDIRVTLKTAKPEPALICFVQVPIRKQLTGTLKQGQKIRVWGQEVNGQKDKVQLYQVVLYEASE
jgi:hypothetical protein